MIGLALGVPKMGKTQALLDYVGAHALSNRFFVVDRADDWRPSWEEGHRWRAVRFRKWTPREQRLALILADVALPVPVSSEKPWFADAPSSNVEGWASSLPPCGVFRFPWPYEGPQVAELARSVGDVTYVDDEIDLVAVFESWKTNPLRDFCHRGRHLPNAQGKVGQVHILGAARRPQNLHIDVTSLADFVWVFRSQGHRTLKRLLDDRILEEGEEETARTLPPYHFKLWQASEEPVWGVLAPLREGEGLSSNENGLTSNEERA